MISALWILFLVLFWIIIIVVYIIFQIRFRQQSRLIDLLPNQPKIDMTNRRQFTEGYVSGVVKTIQERKNGVFYVEVYPDDGQQGENIPLPPMVKFCVKKQFLLLFPQGEKSSRRTFMEILPRSKLDLPERKRNTLEAGYLMNQSAKAFIEENIGAEIQNQFKAVKEIHEERAGGELTRERLELLSEQIKQLSSSMNIQPMEKIEDKNKKN